MNLARALTFPFTDRRNLGPLAIAFTVTFVACGGFAVSGPLRVAAIPLAIAASLLASGWGMRIVRRVAEGDDDRLPDWRSPRALDRDGIRFFVVLASWMFLVLVPVLGVTSLLAISGRFVSAPLLAEPSKEWSWLLILAIITPFQAAAIARAAVEGSLDEGLRLPTIAREVFAHARLYALVSLGVVLFALLQTGFDLLLGQLGLGTANLAGAPLFASSVLISGTFASHLYGQAFRLAQPPLPSLPLPGSPATA